MNNFYLKTLLGLLLTLTSMPGIASQKSALFYYFQKKQDCSQTFVARNHYQLFLYKLFDGTFLHTKKNLIIDFNLYKNHLEIVSPCSVQLAQGRKILASHIDILANLNISIERDSIIKGNNIKLRAQRDLIVGSETKILGSDLFGSADVCEISESANILATNISGNCFDVGSSSPPVLIGDQNFETEFNQIVSIELNGATSENDLTYEVVDAPLNGTLTGCLEGSEDLICDYTANSNFVGTDSFSYRAFDGVSFSDSVSTVTIIVNAPIPPVILGDQQAQGSLDETLAIDLLGATSAVESLTYEVVLSPTNGVLSDCLEGSSDLNCEYRPNPGFFGTDFFTYRAFDGFNSSITVATVSIEIIAPAPQMIGDQLFNTQMNEVISIELNGATGGIGALSYEVVSGPANGIISDCLENTGDIICNYEPNDGFFGQDSFTYRAFDGNRFSEVNSTVTINVEEDVCLTREIVFEDSQLLEDIYNVTGITAGTPLFFDDVNVITELYSQFSSDRSPITSLSGLECVRSLQTLNIAGNEVDEISYLEGLSELVFLVLNHNKLSSISSLSSKSNLQVLRFSGNTVSDLSPLANSLSSLLILDFIGNNVTDLSPISGATSLGQLLAAENELIDVSPIATLATLTAIRLDQNNITDISPLENLSQLSSVDISQNQIESIEALANKPNLQGLNILGNLVSDLSPLSSSISNLSFLNIGLNQISEISLLSEASSLTQFFGASNQIVDISPISGLVGLDVLFLELNNIVDISPISNLSNLSSIRLDSNEILDPSPLDALANSGNLERVLIGSNPFSCPNPTIDNLISLDIEVFSNCN